MITKNKITVLSTFANDRLIDNEGNTINEQKGGPAFFFEQVFRKGGVSFYLETGPKIKVEILITKDGEFGKASRKNSPKKIAFSRIETPYLLLTTVLDDFYLNNISDFHGRVFMDVQGYVRDGNDFGKKKMWNPDEKVFSNIFCLKATEEEVKYIPRKYIKNQKQKILLITKGRFGCEVFVFGKRYIIKPSSVIKGKHAIGAGDTFFAYFVSSFIKTEDIISSVKYSMKETSGFLSSK